MDARQLLVTGCSCTKKSSSGDFRPPCSKPGSEPDNSSSSLTFEGEILIFIGEILDFVGEILESSIPKVFSLISCYLLKKGMSAELVFLCFWDWLKLETPLPMSIWLCTLMLIPWIFAALGSVALVTKTSDLVLFFLAPRLAGANSVS